MEDNTEYASEVFSPSTNCNSNYSPFMTEETIKDHNQEQDIYVNVNGYINSSTESSTRFNQTMQTNKPANIVGTNTSGSSTDFGVNNKSPIKSLWFKPPVQHNLETSNVMGYITSPKRPAITIQNIYQSETEVNSDGQQKKCTVPPYVESFKKPQQFVNRWNKSTDLKHSENYQPVEKFSPCSTEIAQQTESLNNWQSEFNEYLQSPSCHKNLNTLDPRMSPNIPHINASLDHGTYPRMSPNIPHINASLDHGTYPFISSADPLWGSQLTSDLNYENNHSHRAQLSSIAHNTTRLPLNSSMIPNRYSVGPQYLVTLRKPERGFTRNVKETPLIRNRLQLLNLRNRKEFRNYKPVTTPDLRNLFPNDPDCHAPFKEQRPIFSPKINNANWPKFHSCKKNGTNSLLFKKYNIVKEGSSNSFQLTDNNAIAGKGTGDKYLYHGNNFNYGEAVNNKKIFIDNNVSNSTTSNHDFLVSGNNVSNTDLCTAIGSSLSLINGIGST